MKKGSFATREQDYQGNSGDENKPKRLYKVVSPDKDGVSVLFLSKSALHAMESMLYTLNLKKRCHGIIKKSKHGAVMNMDNGTAYFCKEYV